MNIESAQYFKDQNGNVTIIITHDGGQRCSTTENGVTWVDAMLKEWVAAGNVIAPAA